MKLNRNKTQLVNSEYENTLKLQISIHYKYLCICLCMCMCTLLKSFEIFGMLNTSEISKFSKFFKRVILKFNDVLYKRRVAFQNFK